MRPKLSQSVAHGATILSRSRVACGTFVVLGLSAVDAALLGGHLLHGGLYTDDWPLTAIQHQTGTAGLFSNLIAANHERPVGAAYLAITSALSGTNARLHALWSMLAALFAANALYLLLRALALRPREAVAIALLFMVFPFADSAWLWYAASQSYLAIGLAALGGAVSLGGLGREGRAAIGYRVGALGLFAASILTYQVAAGVICLSGLAYLPRTGRRHALMLWAADVCVVAATLVLPDLVTGSAGTTASPVLPASAWLAHATLMADQGLTLLAVVLVPLGAAHRNVVLPVALVIVCVGMFLACRPTHDASLRRECRRGLLLVGVAALLVVAAYAVYVPAPIRLYQPLGRGEENRVNVLASLGYAGVVYGLAMVLATSAVRLLRLPSRTIPVVGIVLIAIVFAGYVHRTGDDIAAWDRASTIQRHELNELRAAGRPPRGTTVYSFGGVGATAPGVFAFRVTWDLNSAVQLLWDDATLHAYPIFSGTTMTCTATQVVPVGPQNGDSVSQAADYRHVVFYDLRTRREQRIGSASDCIRAISGFAPGPVEG